MIERFLIVFRLSLRNIFQNWRHSLATVLSITSGFISVSLFDGFMRNMQEHTVESYVHKGMVGHLLIEKVDTKEKLFEDPWKYSLDEKEQSFIEDYLKKDSRVSTFSRFLFINGMISNGQNSAIFFGNGYDVQEGLKFRGKKWEWNTIAGKPIHLTNTPSILTGIGLAKKMECETKTEDYILSDGTYKPEIRPIKCLSNNLQLSTTTESVQLNAINLPLSGILDLQLREYNDTIAILPLTVAQELLDTKRISRYSVLLNQDNDLEPFLKDFKSFNDSGKSNFEATAWIDHPIASTGKGGLEILRIFGRLFLIVVAIIASMSVANTMMKTINERIREIGSLRSIGFRQNDIVWMFSLEGLFLGFFSCLVGLTATLLLGFIVSNSGFSFKAGILSSAIPLKISFALSTWIGSIIFLSLVTFLVSWIVSLRASRMVIAETMRHVA